MAESASPRGETLQDLYLETNRLYVGTVLDLLGGNYHTINLPEKSKFFPRADERGFILHNSKINTYEEIGQKIIDLRNNYENVFYPRHYNHKGVSAWYYGGYPCPYGLYNYLLKLNQGGVLRGKETRKIVHHFFGYVGVNKSPQEIKNKLRGLKVWGGGGSIGSNINGLPKDPLDFFDTYPTGLLMTKDLNIFEDINSFSIKNTERIIYVFDKQGKLAAVVCKLLETDGDLSIGYCMGDQTLYLVTKDNDIVFVNMHEFYFDVAGEELDYGEYMGPWILKETTSSGVPLKDLYLETNKLYIGTVLDLLNGDYHTMNLPKKSKFFPRADEKGFVLHNSKINTPEEIGQKIVALRNNFDNIFWPRHRNRSGVSAWYYGGYPCPFGLYNYLLKLERQGDVTGRRNEIVAERFFEFLGDEKNSGRIKSKLSRLKISGDAGSFNSSINGLPGHNYGFFDTYPTSLLMTTDLSIFEDIDNFSLQVTKRIIYVFDKQEKLVAVICKILDNDWKVDIGYFLGDQAGYLITKDNDIAFVNVVKYFCEATGEEYDSGDYQGP